MALAGGDQLGAYCLSEPSSGSDAVLVLVCVACSAPSTKKKGSAAVPEPCSEAWPRR